MLTNPLAMGVVQTLAFFDVFAYPLTAPELYERLWQSPAISFSDFVPELDRFVQEKIIAQVDGYYCFVGREEIVRERQRALHRVEAKLRRGQKAVHWLARVPFVRGVAICNTVAFGWPRVESDIDVVVIIKTGRLWLSRFLATVLLSLTRFRRHHKLVADRVCLSFYLTEAALDLQSIALEPPDIYLAYWLTHLIPLYETGDLFARLEQENAWTKTLLPNATRNDTHTHYSVRLNWFETFFKKAAEFIGSGFSGNWLERLFRMVQKYKMKRNVHSVQGAADTRVIVSDTMLKFHENDRRLLYREAWQKNVDQYLSSL